MQSSKASRFRAQCFPTALLFLVWLVASLPASAQVRLCEPGVSPAESVPEQRCSDGSDSCTATSSVQLWPRASDPTKYAIRPAPTIPLNRDSTDYAGKSRPGIKSGHELFMDVAVPGNEEQTHKMHSYVISVYNAGLQIWDISGDPENPQRIANRDIWEGEWLWNPDQGELKELLTGVDALQVGNEIFIAVAGKKFSAGFSIWKFNTQTRSFQQLYQDLSGDSRSGAVKLVQADSTDPIYAIHGETGGARVYNVTKADSRSTPCLETADESNTCGVYRGLIGDPAKGASRMDAIAHNGQIFVGLADASTIQSVNFEIWQLGDPQFPGTSSLNRKVVDTLSGEVDEVELFKYSGVYYAAVVEAQELKIFSLTGCLTSTGCNNPKLVIKEDLQWKNPPPDFNQWSTPRYHFLDYSVSNGTPFLHYGFEYEDIWGSGWERIWDLTNLETVKVLPRLTAGGGSYTDPCNGQAVDYLADYYAGNDHGLSQFEPRHAVFTGPYLYRAGRSVLDIHVRGDSGVVVGDDPAVVTNVTSEGIDGSSTEFWLDSPVSFVASASSCDPVAAEWCWDWEAAVGSNIEPVGLPSGCDDFSTHDVTFYCGENVSGVRCTDAEGTVAAWNLACGPEDPENQFAPKIVLKDPAPAVESATSGGTSFPDCSTISLDATLAGRGPISWTWRASGKAIQDCEGNLATESDLSAADAGDCSWDTSTFSLGPEIFIDDFESGSCGLWSDAKNSTCKSTSIEGASVLASYQGTGSTGQASLEKATSSNVDLVLEIYDENRQNLLGSYALPTITIEQVGDPAFTLTSNPPLATPVVDGGTVTLQAPASDTSLWTWELENPNGADTCNFGSGTVKCEIVETLEDTLVYSSWPAGGPYDYRVSLSNCRSIEGVSAQGVVDTVGTTTPPNVTDFLIPHDSPNCNRLLGGVTECVGGCEVTYYVVLENEDSYKFYFDWDTATTEQPNYSTTAESPVDQPTSTAYVFTHTAPTDVSTYQPWVKVSNGAEDTEQLVAEVNVLSGTCE